MSKFSGNFWRILTNTWGIIFLVLIVWDFFVNNALDKAEILLPVAVIHDAVLAIYSAEKEFRRWNNKLKAFHPGEVYVIIWTLVVFGLLGAALITHREYHVPPEVTASYLVILGILAITKESKAIYRTRTTKTKEGKGKK